MLFRNAYTPWKKNQDALPLPLVSSRDAMDWRRWINAAVVDADGWKANWSENDSEGGGVEVVAGRGRSERASRAVEGVRRNVFCWLLWPRMSWPLRVQRHGIYTSMYIYLQPNHIHIPLALDCPHSQRTLRTPMRKLHTLMRKCLLPQHPCS